MSHPVAPEDQGSLLPVGSGTVAGGRRRPRRGRNVPGCLAVLVVVALIVAGVYLGTTKGVDAIRRQFTDPKDYPGPGTGRVTFQVHQGDSSTTIGRNLKDADIVASVDAFVNAAQDDPRAGGIQPGYYAMRTKMSSQGALTILDDPDNTIKSTFTVPEGARLDDIVATIVKKTSFTKKSLRALIHDPSQIGLPAEAHGNVEGYLAPLTYDVTPDQTAKDLLSYMVSKTEDTEKSLDLATKAKAVGLTQYQVLIVASILEYESNNPADAAKVARVLYNRLKIGMRLQLDSTVAYFTGKSGSVYTTQADRDKPDPYNTYLDDGLPPGPIGSAGETTIKAALNPAKGSWLYFIADPTTGKTLFSDTFDEQQANAATVAQHCRDSPTDC